VTTSALRASANRGASPRISRHCSGDDSFVGVRRSDEDFGERSIGNVRDRRGEAPSSVISSWSRTRACPDAVPNKACDDFTVAATVLIVDDHAGFRTFARALLEAQGFDVVGEAADGASALLAARALAPELVLLDVALPDTDGFAVCEALLADGGGPAVVLTSSRDVSVYRRRLERSRARGFIPKSELSGHALAALAN
jgi:CheY-like chemotaxis protein